MAKRAKRFTAADVAASLGLDASEVAAKLQQGELEKAAREEVKDDVDEDGGLNELGEPKNLEGDGPAPVAAAASAAEPWDKGCVEGKVRFLDGVVREVTREMWRNTIRIEGKGIRVKAFHEAIGAVAQRLESAPNVCMIKIGAYHCDVVHKSFLKPKACVEKIKNLLENTDTKSKLTLTPPYDPYANPVKMPCKYAHKRYCDFFVSMMDDCNDSDRIPVIHKPKTIWPIAEDMVEPGWSIQQPDGTTIIGAKFSYERMEAVITIRGRVPVNGKQCSGQDLADMMRAGWTHSFPFRGIFEVKPVVERAQTFDQWKESKRSRGAGAR